MCVVAGVSGYRRGGGSGRRRHWPAPDVPGCHMSAIFRSGRHTHPTSSRDTHPLVRLAILRGGLVETRDITFHPTQSCHFGGGSWGGSSWREIKSRAMLLQGVDCVSSVFAAVVMMLSLESGNAAGHQAGGMVGFSDLPPILVFAFLFRCLFGFITQHIPSPI